MYTEEKIKTLLLRFSLFNCLSMCLHFFNACRVFFLILGWTSDYDPRKEAPETSRWRSKVRMNT